MIIAWPNELLDTVLVAVMPTVVVGGPLALLALLFPAACGGLTLCFRRWRVPLTVLSTCSTFYLLHSWFYSYFFDSWWESQLELWFFMALTAVVGLMYQRQNSRLKSAAGILPAGEIFILALTAVCCIGGVLWGVRFRASVFGNYLQPLVVIVAAAIAGIWHAVRQCRLQRITDRPKSWDTQSVVLLVAVAASTIFLCKVGVQAAYANSFHLRWRFAPEEAGAIYSSPVVAGHQVFVAAALQKGSTSGMGALYSLDRNSGDLLWTFTDQGRMKQVLSSPCHADGRIYIGEGFHSDTGCKLYCISSSSGEKLWDFETKSHTESTPNVVNGRVYFGAGDDGLYCLDADTGKLIWHFEGPHVDGCPAIANNRVYAGSGHGNCEVFCVDAANGEPVWRVPVEVSSFAAATIAGDQVFFGIGNGNFSGSDANPSGALVCLNSKTGDVHWRHNVSDAVHSKPVVIGDQVVFASRDHYCYSLNIRAGDLRWKRYLGAPILAAPIVAGVPGNDGELGLYILANDGSLTCLNIQTGVPYSTTHASGTSRLNSNFIGTPAVSFTGSALGGHVEIYVGGGNLHQISFRPIVLCFE